MLILLDRKIGGLALGSIARSVAKMLLACLAMAGACWGVQQLSEYPHAVGHFASFEQLAILMLVGGGTYAGACLLLGLRLPAKIRSVD